MIVAGTAAALVGLVLLAAAVAKARDGARFRSALAALLPARAVGPAHWGVVALEAALGLLLLSGAVPALAGALAAATLLVFSGALVVLAARGEPDCGCFGAAPQGAPRRGLVRNGALVAAALAVVVAGDGLAWRDDPAGAAGQVALALAAVLLWRLGEAVADVLANQRRLIR